ncbi:hypothetical protein D8674_025446 [Pyrus ussuriensis x Pyrus communis]|uniref:Uncharacterized protein n=1 Tax=Pyrus ussuriensis x Pyrus communis TaxID=2448454 RepID=A0A5N5HJ58_9ROSA|nr:hypothetical protein D8674_025446 [Pyrus ussuriensis x Pyrus communis]
MEANQTSMKWKRPSPVMRISTGAKSQIQLHTHRSGQARNCDGDSKLPSSEPLRKRPRSLDQIMEGSLTGSLLRNALIKDLRVKRVFSPTSDPPENVNVHQKLGIGFGSQEPENGPKAAKNDGLESSGYGISRSGPNVADSESIGTENSEMGFVLHDASLKSPASKGIGAQQCAQKSSPDAKANSFRVNVDYQTKSVLKPRQRVFKAPGSFSYRRLLPYLNDMAKDNSCMLEFRQQPNLNQGLEGKPFQGKRASENQAGFLHQFNEQKLSGECPSNGSSAQLETAQVSSNETSNDSVVSESPSMTVVEECRSKPPVDEQVEICDLGFSCKVQKLNSPSPSSPSAVEDSLVNKDHVIDVYADGDAPVENAGTANKAGNEFPGKAENVKDINPISHSIVEECYSCKDSEVGQNINRLQNDGMRKNDMGYLCKDQNPNHLNEQRVGKAGDLLNQIDDSNEDDVQMTPPDAEILGELKGEVKRLGEEGYVLQSTNEGSEKPSTAFNHRDVPSVDIKGHESTPKRNMVLNPCSRLKLFRSPGSISYRRLLPFLMDMEKTNSAANLDKDLKQKQLSPVTPNQQETPMDKSNGLKFQSKHQVCDPGTLPTPQLVTANGSSKDGGQNLTSPEHFRESQMPIDLQDEHYQSVKDGAISISELETRPEIMSSEQETVTLLCPSTCEATSIKDGAISVSDSLSYKPEEEGISSRTALSNGGKPLQANSLSQNSSEIAATVSSGIHEVGPRKGILKRNPRGCRGLCSCLNCASFRLHAERAFEFSRNQMLDAEEVAFDLMKELSNLRKILELTAASATNPSMNLNEVKEACRRASEAEGIARNRLGEMNYDLNIHSKVTCFQEPSVTFANYVEEKVIPKEKFSSS